jgi:hypothetical protein
VRRPPRRARFGAVASYAVGMLIVVPFRAGSGRTQADWPAARTLDPTVFGTGVLLVRAGGRDAVGGRPGARVGRASLRETRCGAE